MKEHSIGGVIEIRLVSLKCFDVVLATARCMPPAYILNCRILRLLRPMRFYPGAYGVYGDNFPRFGEHAVLSRNIGPARVCKYLILRLTRQRSSCSVGIDRTIIVI